MQYNKIGSATEVQQQQSTTDCNTATAATGVTAATAATQTERVCWSCRFWQENSRDSYEGTCHRYAPRPTMNPRLNKDGSALVEMPLWPSMPADEWCGEWRLRKPLRLIPEVR